MRAARRRPTCSPGSGIDEFFTRTDSVGVRNYLTDALGSSVALADGSGTVQTEYTYEPFGAIVSTGSGSANSFGFRGREFDNSGVQFAGDRYVIPGTLRFASEGPPGRRFGFNFYVDGEDSAPKWHAPVPEILIFGQHWWVRTGPGRYVPYPARPMPRPTPPPVPRPMPPGTWPPEPIVPPPDPYFKWITDSMQWLSGGGTPGSPNNPGSLPPAGSENQMPGRKVPPCDKMPKGYMGPCVT